MGFAASYFTGASGAAVVVAAAAVAGYMAMNIGANDVTNNVGGGGRRKSDIDARGAGDCGGVRDRGSADRRP